ncbi:MAG: phage late control D family protein [Pseudonocardiaceae bacterium]
MEIDEKQADYLYPDVIRVEVELDEELAAMFRIELSMQLEPDGTWRHLDDKRLTPWRHISIHVGFEDGTEPLMSGYVTHVHSTFDRDLARCRLELWGMDGSALMDREERLRAWPDKKDSDIAKEILSGHGFTPEVQDTAVIHNASVSTIVQRETDMQFLRRLALRNGFECFVDGKLAYFRAPPAAEAAKDVQPLLAVHFGAETNVGWFTAQIDARSPSEIGMFQLHRTDKQVVKSLAEASLQPALGTVQAASLLPKGLPRARAYVGMNATTGATEMDSLCQSLFHRAEWFVTGEGLIDGNSYGSVLRPRRPVTIKGVGETHSGVYYVTHVTHTIDTGGYTQRFQVKRNGLKPKGDEDFSGVDGLLGGL